MRKGMLFLCCLISIQLLNAQEEEVAMQLEPQTTISLTSLVIDKKIDLPIRPVVLHCSVIGKTITTKEMNSAFKEYQFSPEAEHWDTPQLMFTALQSKIPGLGITNIQNLEIPQISIRSSSDVTIIVDGVAYNASILSSLNIQDIESIKVIKNSAAANYYRNASTSF